MLDTDFEAVIFDCDGTLVDSEPITVRVLVDFVAEHGLNIDYGEALALFVGRDMPGIVSVLESRMGSRLPSGFCEEYRARQAIALRRDLQVVSGAYELLAKMTKPFCVASNAPQDKIAINLSTTGLDRYFTESRTFSAYDINSWKPEPDLFHHAARQMGHVSSNCVVIEDSVAGIQAGLAAGCQVIGFSACPSTVPTTDVPFVHCLSDLIDILAR